MNRTETDLILLCIDAQSSLVNAVRGGSDVLKRCRFAVSAARGLGVPVVFTEQVPEKLGETDAGLLEAAGPEARGLPKQTFSALADEEIMEAVRQHNPAHILLCGFEMPICVYQTAIHAIGEGFAVTLLSDAVGSRRETDARACMDELARAGVHVLPSETVFYSMIHDSEHPFFRKFTKLLKQAV